MKITVFPCIFPSSLIVLNLMKYFLVFQSDTYETGRDLKCLWAPDTTSNHSHKRMLDVSVGDSIIHINKQKIRAISLAQSSAYASNKPEEFETSNNDGWKKYKTGRKIDIDIIELNQPVSVNNIKDKIMDFYTDKYFPYTKDGGGNQGYLYEISEPLNSLLLSNDFTNEKENAGLSTNISEPKGGIKTKATIDTRSAVWQGYFKKKLQRLWSNTCSITGYPEIKHKNKSFLIAAHIKPYAKCSDKESFDEYNGLLLSPNMDKLFEHGMISIDNDGKIMLSSKLDITIINNMKLNEIKKINVHEKNKIYLNYHRTNKFVK